MRALAFLICYWASEFEISFTRTNVYLDLVANPARSDLSIQTQGAGIDRLTLFDASSRPVLQVNPGGQQLHRMDISRLAPEVYIVRAECAGEVLTEKLVVTR